MKSKCLLIATLLCICLPIKANSQSYSYTLGDLYDYTPGGINDYDKFLRVTRLNLSTLEQQELSTYQYSRRRYIDINSYNDFYDTGIDLSSGGQSVHDVSANKIRIFGRNPADNINSPETGASILSSTLRIIRGLLFKLSVLIFMGPTVFIILLRLLDMKQIYFQTIMIFPHSSLW